MNIFNPKPRHDLNPDGPRQAILKNVAIASPDTTLEAAFTLIRGSNTSCDLSQLHEEKDGSATAQPEKHKTGCLLITNADQQVIGVLTEQDLLRLIISDSPTSTTTVEEVMTTPVVTIRLEEYKDIFAASRIMKARRIRYLPVVDSHGKLEGLITQSSLRKLLKESHFLRLRRVHEIMTSTVVTASPSDSLQLIARLLVNKQVSCIVICSDASINPEDQIPVGILTEGDLVQLKRLGIDFNSVEAGKVMSTPLTFAQPNDSMGVVLNLMASLYVRRLVIKSPSGTLAGIVTETNLTSVLEPQELYGVMEIMQSTVNHLRVERKKLLLQMDLDLEQGFRNSEFYLVYQPLLNLKSGRICGAEALLRWQSQIRGNIPPNHFIPLAEDSGMIVELGYWILEKACKQGQTWLQSSIQPISMAVNVSSIQLEDPNFIDRVSGIIRKTDFPGELLHLELTESVLAENFDGLAKVLDSLQAQGIKISIDDFGTGFSSLAYLQHFNFNFLKIDRSFVSGIEGKQRNQAIVDSIIQLSSILSFEVVGEGVETEAELDLLRNKGCHMIQGYLFSRPLPVYDWADFTAGLQDFAVDPLSLLSE
jgi:EAL domain-containing protein (putative c-di-GMP-specific phosphodiesterase class I)/CBS domain-containing protein